MSDSRARVLNVLSDLLTHMTQSRLWTLVEMADAWWDCGDPTERVVIGGTLMTLLASDIILLNEVLTAEQAADLLINLGPLGSFNALSLVVLMIAFYMIRPGKLYSHVRERRGEVDQ